MHKNFLIAESFSFMKIFIFDDKIITTATDRVLIDDEVENTQYCSVVSFISNYCHVAGNYLSTITILM